MDQPHRKFRPITAIGGLTWREVAPRGCRGSSWLGQTPVRPSATLFRLIVVAALGAAAVLVLGARSATALAACNSPTLKHVQAVADDPSGNPNSNIQGGHSNIHVNDFSGDPQCYTGRSIAVVKDIQTDYVEIGWVTGSEVPGLHAQNQTVVYDGLIDGVPIANHLTSHHPAPDSDHQFKLANGDANTGWAVKYDGNELTILDSGFSHGAKVLTNTEKHYTNDDSLWSHFQGIGVCTHEGGSCDPYFHTPDSLNPFDNSTSNYFNCKIDNSELYVRKDHC
jgi:hypothetical protein